MLIKYFSLKVGATLAFFNMLVPYPGTRDFEKLFSSTPLHEIEWDNFVAIGEKCVLKNVEVSATQIEDIISKANIRYYANPKRLFNIVVRTLF